MTKEQDIIIINIWWLSELRSSAEDSCSWLTDQQYSHSSLLQCGSLVMYEYVKLILYPGWVNNAIKYINRWSKKKIHNKWECLRKSRSRTQHQLYITGWGNISGCAALYWVSEKKKMLFHVGLFCDECVSPWAVPLVDNLCVSGGAQVSTALYPLSSYSWQTPTNIDTHRATRQAGKTSP